MSVFPESPSWIDSTEDDDLTLMNKGSFLRSGVTLPGSNRDVCRQREDREKLKNTRIPTPTTWTEDEESRYK